MNYSCPNPKCVFKFNLGPKKRQIVRNGYFLRKSDSRKIPRFFCRFCGSYFSSATFSDLFAQKARRITAPLRKLMVSGVSQRRAAKILGVNPKTVVRRFRLIAELDRKAHEKWLSEVSKKPLHKIQFDDLETAEHTKCKPLSVALAVEPKERKILAFQVSQMPAKGTLVDIARKKYGPRKDKRKEGWNRLMKEIKPCVTPQVEILSDDNPHYPKIVRRHFPQAKHITTPGGRGSISGQGELKKLVFDPLFSLNHTCAMLRANINRLFRKTWCITKTVRGLVDHLSIYIHYHNTHLTRPLPQS